AGGGEAGGSGLGVAAAGGRADDVVAGVGERAEQRGQVGRAPDAHEFHAALGHAVGGVVGQGGVGVRRDDDVGDAEEGGGAHDGAEVVGVADAIEHDQRGAARGPAGDVARGGRGEAGGLDDGDDAAVVERAGDLGEF